MSCLSFIHNICIGWIQKKCTSLQSQSKRIYFFVPLCAVRVCARALNNFTFSWCTTLTSEEKNKLPNTYITHPIYSVEMRNDKTGNR